MGLRESQTLSVKNHWRHAAQTPSFRFVVDLLNNFIAVDDDVFASSAFDEGIKNFSVYKVETIGDSYVVTSGLPHRIGDRHAPEMAGMALHLLAVSERFSLPGHSSERLPLRIGINCGERAPAV